MRNLSAVSSEDILQHSFKFFKILVLIIVVNISINEAFFELKSSLFHEFLSELVYLIFFYVGFLFYYYIGAIYQRISGNRIHKVWVIRHFLMLIFVTIIIFQLTGVLNPSQMKEITHDSRITNDILVVILVFISLAIFQSYKLIRKAQIKWYDTGFYFLVYASFIILVLFKGGIIKQIVR
jgi:hypothetical protein